jgi:hypothetical protein
VAGRYGYHRDELYFLVAARHLDWAYVDQPVLTPALGGLARLLFGDSLVGLRLLPALAIGATGVVGGLTARELGGGRAVQVLTAACVAGSGVSLATGHLLSTTTFDLLFWVVIVWLLARLLRTGDVRLWPWIGLAVGLGLENKTTVAQLAGVGLLGLLAQRDSRRLLATRWFALAAGIVVVLWLPWLLWQAGHGWPQLAIFADLRDEDGGLGAGLAFLPLQLLMTNPVLAFVWIGGLVALLRFPGLRPWRPLAFAWLLLVAFYVIVGGKPYYAAGLYPVLWAAGWLWLERRRDARGRPPAHLGRRLVLVALALAIAVPLVLPVLPAAALSFTADVNDDSAETYAWPVYVRQIEAVRDRLPPAERAAAVFVTGNYGEGGALERFGTPATRGRVFSGHNSFWSWGPPRGDGSVVIVVGYQGAEDVLRARFASVTRAATLDNGRGIDNEEQGQPVWVCRGLRGGWAERWIDWRHYDG